MNSAAIDEQRLMQTGDKVRAARKCRGITQRELADLTDLAASTISHLESGANEIKLSSLYRIADVLQVDLRELCPDEIQCLGAADKDWRKLEMRWRNLDEKGKAITQKAMLAMIEALEE